MDNATFLDRFTLASATDDLVAPSVAAAQGLPQIRSWNNASLLSRPAGVPRDLDSFRKLSAASGGYDASYFWARNGRGISLEFTHVSPAPKVVRLTRLR